MADENRNAQNNSAESTVKSAVKTGKAVSNITRGAATGGIHGAALETAKASKKWIFALVGIILIPIVIVAMLPSVIFGSLLGDGTETANGISDNAVLTQNMVDLNTGISTILSEGLTDVSPDVYDLDVSVYPDEGEQEAADAKANELKTRVNQHSWRSVW